MGSVCLSKPRLPASRRAQGTVSVCFIVGTEYCKSQSVDNAHGLDLFQSHYILYQTEYQCLATFAQLRVRVRWEALWLLEFISLMHPPLFE